jgi:hypothetical protein
MVILLLLTTVGVAVTIDSDEIDSSLYLDNFTTLAVTNQADVLLSAIAVKSSAASVTTTDEDEIDSSLYLDNFTTLATTSEADVMSAQVTVTSAANRTIVTDSDEIDSSLLTSNMFEVAIFEQDDIFASVVTAVPTDPVVVGQTIKVYSAISEEVDSVQSSIAVIGYNGLNAIVEEADSVQLNVVVSIRTRLNVVCKNDTLRKRTQRSFRPPEVVEFLKIKEPHIVDNEPIMQGLEVSGIVTYGIVAISI